jgi:hypothetical protein
MCVAWARMLAKKTKVYCVDGNIKHDEKDYTSKFVTAHAGIVYKDWKHLELNYESGILAARNKQGMTMEVVGMDCTVDGLLKAGNPPEELKSTD